MSTPNRTDITIAGAGLTGRLLALALAQRDFAVTLIDPSDGTAPGDARTTAIAYASARLFDRLGVWGPLKAQAGTISDILVTNGRPQDRFRPGGTSGGALHFPAQLLSGERVDADAPALGYIVENRAIHDALTDALAAAEVDIRTHTQVAGTNHAPGEISTQLNNGSEVTSDLVIGCDGRGSVLRAKSGIRTKQWGYDQKALAFNLSHTKPHNGVAHEVFYPQGPFAILPMKGNRVSIVWTEKGPLADALAALPEEAFLEEVYNRIGPLLGKVTLDARPQVFPLSFVLADTPIADRMTLAGDAYHGIHPIAGQGFNLGVKDIAVLIDVLTDARGAGLDIGSRQTLDQYVRWRRFDVASLAYGTDALTRLFSNDIAPVRVARGLGLGLVQHFDRARTAFMRQAGADTGDLPSLMAP